MTKESPMTKAGTSAHAAVSILSFGLCHSLAISVSSLVNGILILAIRAYQLTISPAQAFIFGPTSGCRFTPTCSQYGIEAIRERGAVAGSWLTAKRICRCHPFGGCGHDPVPQKNFQPSAN